MDNGGGKMSINIKDELKFDSKKGEVTIQGHRIVLASASLLLSIHMELIDTIGAVAGTLLYTASKNAAAEETKTALDKMPLLKLLAKTDWGKKELVNQWIPIFNSFGVGALEVVEINPKERIVVRVNNSYSSVCYREMCVKSTQPLCHLLRGLFAGGFSVLLKTDYDAEEVKCASKGDPYCEFVLTPVKKI